MAELRWILLAIGAAIIVAIWVYGRFIRKPKRRPLDENLIDAVQDDALPELADVVEPGLSMREIEELRGMRADDDGAPAASPDADPEPQLIIAIHVRRSGRPISGDELFAALIEENLGFGRMDIFHHTTDDGEEVFSAANMVEPGTFDPVRPEELSTPGVTMFAVLPGPLSAAVTLERMLSCARGLAAALGADVLDETRSALTRQTEAHLREKAAQFDARLRALRRDG